MKKQLVIIGIVLVTILLGISGCLEETKEKITVNAPLNTLMLKLDDIQGDYEKFDEAYVTEPYIVPKGLLLEGWKVLEKYEVRFSQNESDFILQTLAKLKSKEKCKEFIDKIETQNMSYIFSKVEMDNIGEESYLGKNITTLVDHEVTLYFLSFRIEDVIVVLLSSEQPKDVLIEYANIVENNINASLESKQR